MIEFLNSCNKTHLLNAYKALLDRARQFLFRVWLGPHNHSRSPWSPFYNEETVGHSALLKVTQLIGERAGIPTQNLETSLHLIIMRHYYQCCHYKKMHFWIWDDQYLNTTTLNKHLIVAGAVLSMFRVNCNWAKHQHWPFTVCLALGTEKKRNKY